MSFNAEACGAGMIEEAAAYFGIGQKKIRSLVQTHENDDFI